MKHKYSLSCDIGGTFTDFVLLNMETNERHVLKYLTTYPDPSKGVLDGIKELLKTDSDFLKYTQNVLHGTTLIINAIIERKGAKVGLITTKGFRDLIEISREIRYDAHDIHAKFPTPLVSRYLRREVDERIYSDGRILKELNLDQARIVLKELEDEDVESIAVSLMHSYKNPIHENRIEKIILEDFPGMACSISSKVLPEIREFERTMTTVANAYVKPITEKYLSTMSKGLESLGFKKRLYLMLSSGGLTPLETAKEFPVRLIESGPVSGLIAANYCVNFGGVKKENVISLDMGGTTAKSAIISKGKTSMTQEYEVAREARFKKGSGIPLRISAVDMIEIGAGGGSIAKVDEFGLLQVGPESSGASPGPACYSKGGEDPTVTDADLVLGYLNPEFFLGGEMKLNREMAVLAIERKIAKPLGLTLQEAAWGIHNMVNENMASALKIFCGEKGDDPSMYTLVAFGGAGPVHAYGVASKLNCSQVIIPPDAGTFSALGFFIAPISFDVSSTYKTTLQEANFAHIEEHYRKMERKATGYLPQEDKDLAIYTRSADLRYVGQDYEINIPIPDENFTRLTKDDLLELFNIAYKSTYGRIYLDLQIEVINLRVAANIPRPKLQLKSYKKGGTSPLPALKGKRKAYSPIKNSYDEFTVYDHSLLSHGMVFEGPAIVEAKNSAVFIEDDVRASFDGYGNLTITLEAR